MSARRTTRDGPRKWSRANGPTSSRLERLLSRNINRRQTDSEPLAAEASKWPRKGRRTARRARRWRRNRDRTRGGCSTNHATKDADGGSRRGCSREAATKEGTTRGALECARMLGKRSRVKSRGEEARATAWGRGRRTAAPMPRMPGTTSRAAVEVQERSSRDAQHARAGGP